MSIVNYISERDDADSVFGGCSHLIFCIFHVIRSYFQHLFRGQFRVPMPFSLRHPMFNRSVLSIRFSIPYEKMVWSDTGRVVASVQNVHSFGNFPIVHNPRNSVCLMEPVSEPKNAIPIFVGTTDPKPTAFGFEHLPPKPVLHCSVTLTSRRLNFWTNVREWYNLVLHNSVCLICATLSAAHTAREHFCILAQSPMKSTV